MDNKDNKIKPMEVIKVGVGYALFDYEGTLLMFNRDRSKVEDELQAIKRDNSVGAVGNAAEVYDLNEPQQTKEEPKKEQRCRECGDVMYSSGSICEECHEVIRRVGQ